MGAGGIEPPPSCVSSDGCLYTVREGITGCPRLSSTYGLSCFGLTFVVLGCLGVSCWPNSHQGEVRFGRRSIVRKACSWCRDGVAEAVGLPIGGESLGLLRTLTPGDDLQQAPVG